MTLITCRNGHRYNPEITSECPECAVLKNGTIPLITNIEYIDFSADEIEKTVPLKRDPLEFDNKTLEPDNQPGMDDWGITQPVHYDMNIGFNKKVSRAITGWLVCIEGPEKGLDYRLHDEYNYIGRSSDMDVCIAGDDTVSRTNHAIIAYDTQENVFFFGPASGASLIRHNGKIVMSNVALNHGDRLQIGKGTFLFVPLCSGEFKW